MSEDYPATILLLIRHAQARAADSSRYGPDTPIGQLGRLQVAALVSRLVAAAPPAVVYSSPLPRAVHTASPVCEQLGLEPVLDPRLIEFEMGEEEIEVILERSDLLIWHHRAPWRRR